MTLTDWLHRLERLHFKAIDMGLERVSQVAQQLGLLQDLPFIFTIGGTNGKGSTVAFLESILREHGYRVGVYTSPHLLDFNERVRVNGHDIDDATLIAAFEQVEAGRADISLTYFEFTTVAAMLIFKQAGLDVLVLEVGLGGRLDAVNVWDADVAVVTAIDLDHQQFLGDTREKIGLEKIGIGRPTRPLVLGEVDTPDLVLNSARALRLQVQQLTVDFDAWLVDEASGWWSFKGHNSAGEPVIWEQLPATHLYWKNAALALQALAMSPFTMVASQLQKGIRTAALTGRQQLVQQHPAVMLDVGHNPHAAAHLAQRLRQVPYGRVHCVIGMLNDKSIADTVAELLDVVDAWYPVTLIGERGQQASVIEAELQQAGANIGFCDIAPAQAYRKLLRQVEATDLILVFGSFYTVADVIQYRKSVAVNG